MIIGVMLMRCIAKRRVLHCNTSRFEARNRALGNVKLVLTVLQTELW